LSTTFSRSLIGGDIGGLAALALKLKSYPLQMGNVVNALDHHVDGLVNDAGWSGPAADSFKRRWEVDAHGAQALADVLSEVSTVIDDLATSLGMVNRFLEQARDDALLAGVPVGPDGRPPVLLLGANPAIDVAATTYKQEWQLAQDMAADARMLSNRQLMGLAERLAPKANGSGGQLLRPDELVTEGDFLSAFLQAPEKTRKNWHDDRIPQLRAERDAARRKYRDAQEKYGSRHRRIPDEIKAARKETIQALEDANAHLDKLERLEKKIPVIKLLDARVGSLLNLAPGVSDALDGLKADSKLFKTVKVLKGVPILDVGLVVIGAGMSSYDDVQKGDDVTTAVPQELVANGAGLLAGIAVGAAVGAGIVALGVSAPAAVVVGAAVAAGIATIVVTDAIDNAFHEHWDEDIHKYGVVGGVGNGLANITTKTGKDMKDLVSHTWNTATSLWHGVFH
jgi:uncharacterized protein YukE